MKHRCGTEIKTGYEWESHYYYCPKCREEVCSSCKGAGIVFYPDFDDRKICGNCYKNN